MSNDVDTGGTGHGASHGLDDRMELRVAVETWIERVPEFRLAEGAEVTWAGGQVRGPRTVPVVF